MENENQDVIENETKFVELEIRNYKTILEACELAIKKKKMIGVTGYPGAGKTTSLTKIAFRYNALWQSHSSNSEKIRRGDNQHNEPYVAKKYPPTVVYVCAKPSMQPKDLFRDIFTSLGSTHYDYNLNNIISLCVDSFMGRIAGSEGGLLIIDECGKLSQKQLELIHEFRDLSGNGFGIILSGPESFHRDFLDMIKKGKKGMSELYSRINKWEEMLRPSKAEIAAIIEQNGIDDNAFIQRCIGECQDFRKLYNRVVDYKDSIL